MAYRDEGGEVEILERGNIYFFYQPAVGEEAPKGLVDVQRFHFVLSPERRDLFRMITVGKKRLPEPDDAGQRFWGFVEKVGRTSVGGFGPGRPARISPSTSFSGRLRTLP